MEKFTRLKAKACALPLENIDTDQLIPARFMSRPRSAGYGGFLLHDVRFHGDGTPKGFPLDDPAHAGAKILIARRNFGTGSSREAAVYALWDFGIRCVIAPSFGDIFASNATKNGLLAAVTDDKAAETLIDAVTRRPDDLLTVDLEAQQIRCGETLLPFTIDPVRRRQLLNGWDDLDLTLQHTDAIAQYRSTLAASRPWAVPQRSGG